MRMSVFLPVFKASCITIYAAWKVCSCLIYVTLVQLYNFFFHPLKCETTSHTSDMSGSVVTPQIYCVLSPYMHVCFASCVWVRSDVIRSCLWSMGTTASAAPQPVSVASPLESVHGNGMADSRQSLSMSPFQTVNIHNNKAKSIITNKVAPVVIT